MSFITQGRRTIAGRTKPGSTDWKQYRTGNGIYVDVDTTSGRFAGTPVYTTSIYGDSHHWATVGASSIYKASATMFRVYIRWVDGSPLTPETANNFKWHINWVGKEISLNA